MRKIALLLTGLLTSAILFAQKTNDPNAELREAKDFHGIEVSNAFDVYLSQSNEEAVAVSAVEIKYRDRIIVEVRGGILHISYNNKGLDWISGRKKLKAYISFKKIDMLSVSGACDVFISGTIREDNLAIELSGASNLKGNVDIKKLGVDLSGASDMRISGTATQLDLDVSGASHFRGYDLVTDICKVSASGSSDIQVTVNKELSADASGASDVHYKGRCGKIEQKASGSSSISKG